MEKTAESEMDPIAGGAPIPHDTDTNYELKRVGWKPPVSPLQFRRRFYHYYKGGKRHLHFFSLCKQSCTDAKDALMRIPKKKEKIPDTVDETKENVF